MKGQGGSVRAVQIKESLVQECSISIVIGGHGITLDRRRRALPIPKNKHCDSGRRLQVIMPDKRPPVDFMCHSRSMERGLLLHDAL